MNIVDRQRALATDRPLPAVAPVRLHGLATALAPHVLAQSEVRETAARRFGGTHADGHRLMRIFETAGIDRRRSVVPLDWFDAARDHVERTRRYLEGATAMFVDAASRALSAAGIGANDVDTVVTVSSTGIATPTLEARAHAALGFRTDVQRVPVFGLGCAGGVTGLAIAARLARARPGTRVLVVIVEACTLGFRGEGARKADIVASVLFGDGAAAAVMAAETGGPGPELGEGAEHLWPGTLDIMGWQIDPSGLQVVFDRSIPDFVARHLREALPDGLGSGDGAMRPVFHPGGAKVILALEDALSLGRGALAHERAVLREHGNMSAPTVLFVLERALAEGSGGTLLLAALGPGFTLSTLPVRAGSAA